ncbi:hypothetical protein BOX15_Mlig021689g1, partial [Macrostomum lignano]
KGGSQAVTFTKAYLQSGSLILRDSVKILAFNYLPNQPVSQGVNDFLRMTLPQLQFKNPSVQMLTMQNLAPTPFIQCYMEAEGRRELLIDCSHRKRQEIQSRKRTSGVRWFATRPISATTASATAFARCSARCPVPASATSTADLLKLGPPRQRQPPKRSLEMAPLPTPPSLRLMSQWKICSLTN